MKIGDIDLGEKPVLLAPMEDVTDASFRIVCKRFGADMVYTEFVPSDGLIRDAAKAIAKMKTSDDEAPIGIQIYGNNPEAMVEAAKMADNADQIAGGHGCDVIDINFGCPVSKIAGRGAGSGMMREPDKMVMITKSIVEAVRKPVTVKTRLGWDEDSKIIVELAERLQDTGIKAFVDAERLEVDCSNSVVADEFTGINFADNHTHCRRIVGNRVDEDKCSCLLVGVIRVEEEFFTGGKYHATDFVEFEQFNVRTLHSIYVDAIFDIVDSRTSGW